MSDRVSHWQTWPPPCTSRVLAVREVNGQRYVDVMVYVHEPESGLPKFPSQKGCTHWMPLPAAPNEPETDGTHVWIDGLWCPLDSDGEDL